MPYLIFWLFLIWTSVSHPNIPRALLSENEQLQEKKNNLINTRS